LVGARESANARILHIVHGDHAVRAAISMSVTRSGNHAQIYEDIVELIAAKPAAGAILTKEPAGGCKGLSATLHAGEIFLPIILFAENPRPSQVVRAVHDGAADFLSWPFSDEELAASCEYSIASAAGSAEEIRRRKKAQKLIEKLSQRERQILTFMIDGHSNKSMGLTLDLSPRTVEDYRLNCLQKLGVASSSAAIRIGLEAGLHLAG
jgi:FixJ family two-component response regulator